MSQQNLYETLCRKCYIKHFHPSKKEISKMVMSEEKYECDCCGRVSEIVEYIEE